METRFCQRHGICVCKTRWSALNYSHKSSASVSIGNLGGEEVIGPWMAKEPLPEATTGKAGNKAMTRLPDKHIPQGARHGKPHISAVYTW